MMKEKEEVLKLALMQSGIVSIIFDTIRRLNVLKMEYNAASRSLVFQYQIR